MRQNQLYFISFYEGDSTLQESHVIIAVTTSIKKAEKMFLDYFKQNKLPTFNYQTSSKIIRNNVLKKLTLCDVRFTHKRGNPDVKNRKEAEWKKLHQKIRNYPTEKETVERIFHEVVLIP